MDAQDKMLADITLEKTRELLKNLESGDIAEAKTLIDGLTQIREASMFCEIGKITRQLHEAIANFQLGDQFSALAAQDMPDAAERLNYVIETTENAANKTMDSVEQCIPIAQHIQQCSGELLNDWNRMFRRELQPGEFRELAEKMKSFLEQVDDDSKNLNSMLTDVLVAQDYQDLTGQVIRRVIELVQEVEDRLVDLIKVFGNHESYEKAKTQEKKVEGVEGPVIDKKREDVVNTQDDVDDLLSSLGF